MLSQTVLGLQTVPLQLCLLHERKRGDLWLQNPFNPVRLDCGLATFGAPLKSSLVVAQRSRCYAGPVRLRHDLRPHGYLERLLDALLHTDGVPSVDMYRAVLKACADRQALAQAKLVHGHLAKYGLESTIFLGEYVVITFIKCGSLEDAIQVFERLQHRSVLCWTAVISGYAKAGQGRKALRLYQWMQGGRVHPNAHTFVSLLKACGSIADLEAGKRIHADASKYGCEDSLVVQTCLIDMYGKCGSTANARNVFDGLSERDVVAWNAMLAAYAQQGEAQKALQLYLQLREQGVSPNARTFVSTLQTFAVLADNEEYVVVGDVSPRGRSLGNGKNVFEGSLQRDVVIWNAMLAACIEQGQGEKALQLYERMQEEGVSSNARTFVSTLQACDIVADAEEAVDGQLTKLKSLKLGRVLHADVRRKGYSSDLFVGSSLVSMYGTCGSIVDAQTVFDGLTKHDVVAWTAMLAAYVEQGEADKALQLYEQMQEEGVSSNSWTYVAALQACGVSAEKEGEEIFHEGSVTVKCLGKGKAIHADAWVKGYDSHPFVGNSLVTMYGKCGSTVDAWNIFEGLSMRDVVSWNAMLMAYVQQGQADKALQLFGQMQEEGRSPDEITVLWALQACSKAGCLETVRQIHQTVVSGVDIVSPFIASTLIIAYGRCASMADAQTVFDALPGADVVSWNALIASYAREGNCVASLHCYEKMQVAGLHPNGVTFLSLLSACSHAGLLNKGIQYFQSMSNEYGLSPEIEHYVSLLDLLGRAGCFIEIEEILSMMPVKPNLSLWLCLLGACQKHGKVVLGKQAFDCAVLLQPKHPSAYVLLSNIYADAGLWDKAKEVMQLRQDASAWKNPGQSWIEYEKEVHTFLVGDCQDPERQELYDRLQVAH